MNITVVSNKEKDPGFSCADRIYRRLEALGGAAVTVVDYADFVRRSADGETMPEIFGAEVLVALGGDGTILHVAKQTAAAEKPVLGVNIGRLGFMAAIESNEIDSIGRLLTGEYHIDRRMMFDVTANGQSFLALNDAVISKGAVSRMIDFNLVCNGKFINDYRADGIIVSTPTGSTAYSLSAGGPILDPGLESIGVTPICPHSLIARTILFAPSSEIRVTTRAFAGNETYLTVDGQDSICLSGENSVGIRRASVEARLIRFKDVTFYEALNNKLSEK